MTELDERFWKKVEKQPEGCWLWRGAARNGYGQFWIPQLKRVIPAHQFLFGEFIKNRGFEFHHTCPNTLCINPDHLVKLTRSSHIGEHPPKPRSHCIEGHRLTEENTYIDMSSQSSSGRRCWICKNRRQRKYSQQKRLIQRGHVI